MMGVVRSKGPSRAVMWKRVARMKRTWFLAGAVVGGTAVGAIGVTIASAADRPADRGEMSAPHYAVNANGQTYGSGALATSFQNEPDLIQVMTTNGKTGYAKRTDLEPAAAVNPAQAVAQAKAQGGAVRAPVPVYASDGTTVIGHFAFAAAAAAPTAQ